MSLQNAKIESTLEKFIILSNKFERIETKLEITSTSDNYNKSMMPFVLKNIDDFKKAYYEFYVSYVEKHTKYKVHLNIVSEKLFISFNQLQISNLSKKQFEDIKDCIKSAKKGFLNSPIPNEIINNNMVEGANFSGYFSPFYYNIL